MEIEHPNFQNRDMGNEDKKENKELEKEEKGEKEEKNEKEKPDESNEKLVEEEEKAKEEECQQYLGKSLPKRKVTISKKENKEQKNSENLFIIQKKPKELNENINLYYEIKKILTFLVENIKNNTSPLINEEKQKYYEKSQYLGQIFESLMKKYLFASKTKEEKIKFVLRKSFTYLREQICKENISKKESEDMFFEYFFSSEKDRSKIADNMKKKNNVNEIKDIIMPFRKKSVNKTMNMSFLKKIFSYEKFPQSFKEFTKVFRQVANEDNNKKVDLTAKKIALLLEKNQNVSFRKFKRMP